MQLNTSKYSEFICCDPCLQEFEAVIAYRETLLKNQNALEKLHKKSSKEEVDEEFEEEHLEEEIIVTVKEEEDLQAKEFVDTDAIIECANCYEKLDSSFLDHHVCPRIKTEEDDFDFAEESSMEQDTLEGSGKKKYAKKKLKDPITCPKCNRQFFYKAYFQFHYKDVHREDREEICQFCGKVFKNSRRLNSHILIHQTDTDKKYKCDKCFRQFNFSGDLTRHKRVSTIKN